MRLVEPCAGVAVHLPFYPYKLGKIIGVMLFTDIMFAADQHVLRTVAYFVTFTNNNKDEFCDSFVLGWRNCACLYSIYDCEISRSNQFLFICYSYFQWTTDQDITNAVHEIGVPDFQEVKFFENRSNGQSKGFCVISLGSESSMRLCMERLSKKELHGQAPVVTLPTKQALNQFESQQKTRPVPPQQNGPHGPRGPIPNMGGMQQHPGAPPPGHQPRMMNPNMPPGQFRPQHMPQNMQGPPGPNAGPPRMQVCQFSFSRCVFPNSFSLYANFVSMLQILLSRVSITS